ncbi:MAG: DUF1570 domain-containing protein [Planctomycetes bacterium]|nr:DUF1570 domain-containing protein [Planctomycetota bacterium]
MSWQGATAFRAVAMSGVRSLAGRLAALTVLAAALLAGSEARADFLLYQIPGTSAQILLQGKITVHPGRTVTLQHAKFGPLHFRLQDVQRYEVPSLPEQFSKRLNRGLAAKSPSEVFDAGVWALRHGLLNNYYQAVGEVLKLDPQHAEAKRILALQEQLSRPCIDSPRQEKELRDLITKQGMKIATSKHFILLHDTPERPAKGRKKPRAQERLDLLELVYESFLMTFYSRGVELEIPKERMKVVLFNDYQNYLDFAKRLDPGLQSAIGFWDPKRNVSVFFDHATDETFKALQKMSDQLQRQKEEAFRLKAKGVGDMIQFANTLELLIQVAQENQDIEVVSHEATHQLAGNTGLFPRHVMIPSWVHEGMATYFESPNDAAWSGIGAVNELRLDFYRALEGDREHSNIDFIVGDQIFDYARTHGALLHGYGQAWALTHFLVESHFDKLMTYYRKLGEMPPDVVLSADLLNKLFNEAFPMERGALDQEWRGYMRELKTDQEEVLGE